MQVRSRLASGDIAGAEEASRSAKRWSTAALVTGLLAYAIVIVIVIVYVVMVASFVANVGNMLDDIDFTSVY